MSRPTPSGLAVVYWTGALALAFAPFMIDSIHGKMLAIFGLSVLTLQCYKLKAWNMVAINLIGIGGYTHAIYF